MRNTTLGMGLALALAAAAAVAQPGGGYGPGAGQGPCAAGTAGTACPNGGPGGGYGPGYGRGGRMGGHGFGGMMTDEERVEHRNAMHSFTTVGECKAYWTEHRAEMTARAKERGLEPGPGPRQDPCERMAARGLLKP
ncbi:MAG TPA: hypothetical protein VFX05_09295 [Casimicrobiaceae bacterium]|nr:hypothetical protein [Casimicrobiaceae bacterium]